MATTIQISEETKLILDALRTEPRESYEYIILDLVENLLMVNDSLVQEIKEARNQFERGETYSLEDIKKELGLGV